MRSVIVLVVLVVAAPVSAEPVSGSADAPEPASAMELREQKLERSLSYPSHCDEFISRQGPLAGVVVGSVFSLAGTGVALFGSGERSNGSLTGKGKALIGIGSVMAVGGLIAAVVSGDRLKERNVARRRQTLAGCPPY